MFTRIVFRAWAIHRQLVKRPMAQRTMATDAKLFTPGPLGVSLTTKQAMLRDVGSRDQTFISTVRQIRTRLVELAGASPGQYTCVPMQGSGTFAIEAVLTTAVPRGDNVAKVLILENGAYGKRQAKICDVLGVPYHMESFPEDQQVCVRRVSELLASHPFSLVSVVHCETSSGVVNPVQELGEVIHQHQPGSLYFVDAMSSFGAVPLDASASHIDFLVSSANKCVEGVPGWAYAVCREEALRRCQGQARSYALDLYDQWAGLETTGQFRFTPPTHAMLAFSQALDELEAEGGVQGRAARYQENRRILREGMSRLGFKEFLNPSIAGYIITSYHFPSHDKFNFTDFYQKLSERGQVIYPGKVLDADCFRVGNIGHLFPHDLEHLLVCVEEVCAEMGLPRPLA